MSYKNGRVYVIRNYVNEMVYVGSTVQTLTRRIQLHKTDAKRKKNKLYDAFIELGFENFYIELLELYPCNSKEELTAREGHYIRQFDSYNNGYNGRIEGRTKKEYDKEYKETHKEDNKEKRKAYIDKNRDKLNAKAECECGGRYTIRAKTLHLNTKKHISYINNK